MIRKLFARRGNRANPPYVSLAGRYGLEPLEPRQLFSAVDLSGTFAPLDTLTFDSNTKTSVDMTIHNAGGLAASGKVAVAFFAFTDGFFDPDTATPLNVASASVSIPSGGDFDVTLPVVIPASIAADDYQLAAVIDPDNKLNDENTDDNTVLGADVVTITQPDYNLSAELGVGSKLATSFIQGAVVNGSISVTVTNDGSVATPAGKAVVSVFLRPAGGGEDVNITPKPFALGAINGGASLVAKVPVAVPANIAAGDFTVVVKVDPADGLAETDETDNELVTPIALAVDTAFVDLVPTINPKSVIPTGTTSGDGKGFLLSLAIKNNGNVAVVAGKLITVTIKAHRTSDDAIFDVATISKVKVGGLKAGATAPLVTNFILPPGIPTGDYKFDVAIDTTGAVTESDEGNNTAQSNSFAVTFGHADLAASLKSSTLPAAVVTGAAAKGIVILNVGNSAGSNIAMPKGSTVDVKVVLRLSGSPDVTIGTVLNRPIAALKASFSKAVPVPVAVPTSLPADVYDMVVIVTPTGLIASQSPLEVAAGTFTAAAAFVNLAATAASTSFAGSVVGNSAGAGSVTVKNLGNVAAKGTLKVEFFSTNAGVIDGSAESLGSQTVAFSAAAGASVTIKGVPLVLSNAESATAKQVVVRIAPVTGFTDTTAADDTVAAGNVTITAAPPTMADLMGTMTFTQTGFVAPVIFFGVKSQSTSTGTFVTSTGRAGSYSWICSNVGPSNVQRSAIFQFTFTTGKPASFVGSPSTLFVTFNNLGDRIGDETNDSMNGRAITFTNAKTADTDGALSTSGSLDSSYDGGLIDAPPSFFSVA
jgi:hypothetical protein